MCNDRVLLTSASKDTQRWKALMASSSSPTCWAAHPILNQIFSCVDMRITWYSCDSHMLMWQSHDSNQSTTWREFIFSERSKAAMLSLNCITEVCVYIGVRERGRESLLLFSSGDRVPGSSVHVHIFLQTSPMLDDNPPGSLSHHRVHRAR